mgnify:CR=1 FL=1
MRFRKTTTAEDAASAQSLFPFEGLTQDKIDAQVQSLLELKEVLEEGVRELWFTSEDLGTYGRDIGTLALY